MMTAPDQLADAELLARSFLWRLDVSRGLQQARAYAGALEAEVRRRFAPGASQDVATPRRPPPRRRGWFK